MQQPAPVNDSPPVTLVVGTDSLVGRALVSRLRAAGQPVVGTTRRPNTVDDSHLYLDLRDDLGPWQCPWPVGVAVLCAGVTSLDACDRDPAATGRVNVDAVSTLAKKLVAQGAFVVYLSSSDVFDGSMPCRQPDEPVSPVTEYGRQKAEAERRISQWGDSIAIVRFTKVLGPENPLISSWAATLGRGEPVHPFSDVYMAPVPLATAVSVLGLVSQLRLAGIWQVSGSRDMSYSDAAYLGAQQLRADPRLVQPVAARNASGYPWPVGRHTTLNIQRLKATLGIVPPDVCWTVATAFPQAQTSTGRRH